VLTGGRNHQRERGAKSWWGKRERGKRQFERPAGTGFSRTKDVHSRGGEMGERTPPRTTYHLSEQASSYTNQKDGACLCHQRYKAASYHLAEDSISLNNSERSEKKQPSDFSSGGTAGGTCKSSGRDAFPKKGMLKNDLPRDFRSLGKSKEEKKKKKGRKKKTHIKRGSHLGLPQKSA